MGIFVSEFVNILEVIISQLSKVLLILNSG